MASEGGFHAQACYHCCQAAEKALKALLLALGQEPERTHSIGSGQLQAQMLHVGLEVPVAE